MEILMIDYITPNGQLLDLIGFGLAKFNSQLVTQMGYQTKTSFYEFIVEKGIAKTTGVVKNRQDMFDPFFDNGRNGWWQKKSANQSRFDELYAQVGSLSCLQYVALLNGYILKHQYEDVRSL
jgi:hypothetical protein